MRKALSILSKILEVLTVLCFLILAGITFLNIGGSWVGATNLGWTEEIISCFTTWMVFLGYAYLCERDQHVCVTILHDVAPEGVKNIMLLVIRVANILAGVVLVYGGWIWVRSNATKITSVLQLQYRYWYSAIYICSILFILFALEKLAEQVVVLFKKPESGKKADA